MPSLQTAKCYLAVDGQVAGFDVSRCRGQPSGPSTNTSTDARRIKALVEPPS